MLDGEDLFRFLCKDTSGAGTIYPSGAHEITSAFSGDRVGQSFSFPCNIVNHYDDVFGRHHDVVNEYDIAISQVTRNL